MIFVLLILIILAAHRDCYLFTTQHLKTKKSSERYHNMVDNNAHSFRSTSKSPFGYTSSRLQSTVTSSANNLPEEKIGQIFGISSILILLLKLIQSPNHQFPLLFEPMALPTIFWLLPLAFTTGSFTNPTSNSHRITSTVSILSMLLSMFYHDHTQKLMDPAAFMMVMIVTFVSNISAYRLLRTRVPSYDLNTVRAYNMQISTTIINCLTYPLIIYFGDLQSFELLGKLLLVLFVPYNIFYNVVTIAQMTVEYLKYPGLNNDSFKGWKKPFKCMSHKFILWDTLWKVPTDEEARNSASPSSALNIMSLLPQLIFMILQAILIFIPYFNDGATFIIDHIHYKPALLNVLFATAISQSIAGFFTSLSIHRKVNPNKLLAVAFALFPILFPFSVIYTSSCIWNVPVTWNVLLTGQSFFLK